ncbi:MAG: type IV toxin-antitoxin system AbiEi family antitoxin [Acidimicrobiales bacterium]
MKRTDYDALWDRLLAHGQGTVSSGQIQNQTGAGPAAVRAATANAIGKGLLFSPARGLYVPVPPRYRSWRVVPADHFIDAMMRHLGYGYYVGFLSAAAHWGSAHQAVQEYQVVVDGHVLDRDIERVRLRFHQTRKLDERDIVRVAGAEAMLAVATPNQCAVDLVELPAWGGGLSNVATVLAELRDLDGADLARLADRRARPVAQRLGWLLEHVGADVDLEPLAALVQARSRSVLLDPRRAASGDRSEPWRVIVNTEVEADV